MLLTQEAEQKVMAPLASVGQESLNGSNDAKNLPWSLLDGNELA
jgi:hypothetical protein